MSRFHATPEGNIPFTAEEEAEWDAREATWVAGEDSRKAVEVRAERNAKLAATDWTQIADATVDKAVWATYRQALRNVPTQAGFPNTVVWPTQP
jgi:hypothetical protein